MLRAAVPALVRIAVHRSRAVRRRGRLLAAALCGLLATGAAIADGAAALAPCRLKGIEREVQCGSIAVPEDPDRPQGRRLEIGFALVPALARRHEADPLFVLAGGPGQAASAVAAAMQPVLARVNTRRAIVYVDQRGTGRSNALDCAPERGGESIADTVDPQRALARLGACVQRLGARADLRQYATWIAVRDLDAVRAALGAERINLWGGSYGTRVALEYLRQYPQRVRSIVLDGVAPATMALPASLAVDADSALQAMVSDCAADSRCRERFPTLNEDLRRLRAAAERAAPIRARHPVSGELETLRLDRDLLAGLLRAPLYAPPLRALLPHAVVQAAGGRFEPLLALNFALAGAVGDNFAEAMHFAVVCAEDLPRVDAAARTAARASAFGDGSVALYERACAKVPVRAVPEGFSEAPRSDVPVLILSGGADPVTPPRHGQSVERHLPRALHLIAPHLAHGVSPQGCAPQLIARFLRQAQAAGRGPFAGIEDGGDAGCLARIPAPTVFSAPRTGR